MTTGKHQSVALVGVKGIGKSSVGKRLAGILGLPFFDSDALIVRTYCHDTQSHPTQIRSARDVFLRTGQAEFQAREEAAIVEAAAFDTHVLATGGGIVDNEAALEQLRQSWLIVALEGDVGEAWRRIVAGGIPSFLTSPDPESEFLVLAADRQARYAAASHRSIDVSGKTVDEIATEVEITVMEYRDGRQ